MFESIKAFSLLTSTIMTTFGMMLVNIATLFSQAGVIINKLEIISKEDRYASIRMRLKTIRSLCYQIVIEIVQIKHSIIEIDKTNPDDFKEVKEFGTQIETMFESFNKPLKNIGDAFMMYDASCTTTGEALKEWVLDDTHKEVLDNTLYGLVTIVTVEQFTGIVRDRIQHDNAERIERVRKNPAAYGVAEGDDLTAKIEKLMDNHARHLDEEVGSVITKFTEDYLSVNVAFMYVTKDGKKRFQLIP